MRRLLAVLCIALVASPATLAEPPDTSEAVRQAIETFSGPAGGWMSHFGAVAGPWQEEAVDRLVRIGSPAVPALLRALADENGLARSLAVETLGRIRDARALEPLVILLREDPEWRVREAAAQALRTLPEQRGRKPLLAVVRESEFAGEYPPFYVVEALDAFPDAEVIGTLDRLMRGPMEAYSRSRDGGGVAAETLGDMGRPGLPTLLRAAEDLSPAVRIRAALGLSLVARTEARRALLALLHDPEPTVRGQTLWRLGFNRDRWGMPHLVPLLDDPDPEVRRNAAHVFKYCGIRAAVPGLLRRLDDRFDIAWPAIEALGRLRARAAVFPLIEALGSQESPTRYYALEALGRIGDRRALVPILAHSSERHPIVRCRAVGALGSFRDARARAVLLASLEDPEATVRHAAAEGVGKQRARVAGPALLQLLEDPDREVRIAAAEALGRLREHRARLRLEALLEEERQHYPHTLVIRKALARIRR